jgi:hypothetical protein
VKSGMARPAAQRWFIHHVGSAASAQFLEDARDQRLTRTLLQPEALFHKSVLDT